MRLHIPRELRGGAVIALVLLLALLVMLSLGLLQGIDNWFYSLCFRMRGQRPVPDQIVVIGIDNDSVDELGPWPWPLEVYARLLTKLDAAEADVVVFDISDLAQFSEAQTPTAGAEEFATALAQARCTTVLPAVIGRGTDAQAAAKARRLQKHALGAGQVPRPIGLIPGRLALPPRALHDNCDGIGGLNVYLDRDGVLRSVPLLLSYQRTMFPSLSLESYRQYSHAARNSVVRRPQIITVGTSTFPALSSGEVLINFFGGYEQFEPVPYREVLAAEPAKLKELVASKLVLVGPVTGAIAQLFYTPVDALMPGVEINANAIASLLQGRVIRRVPRWAVIVLMMALALLLGLTVPRASGLFRGTSVTVFVFITCFWLMFWRFTHDVWIPMGGPLLSIGLIGMALVTRSVALADRLRAEANIRLQSRLQAITGVGRLIDSSLERDELLNEIMHWVEAELEVKAASLLLLDEQTNRLSFVVALGEKGDAVKDFTLALGEGIAGTVAQTGEPMVVNEAAEDPRRHPDIPKAIDYPLHNVLCVPMQLHGEVIGVIEAMNKANNMPFTGYDIALLTVIAQQAALFLESARLYSILQHRIDYADAELREANLRLASEKAKLDTMLHEMVDGVIATDEADRVVLINEAAERMLGLSAKTVIGQPVLAAIRQPDMVRLWAMPLSPQGGIHTEEVEMPGPRPTTLQVTVALVGTADEIAGKCMILTDITEFKQIDQLKTDLIAFISHELKTPLTNIGLYTELLMEQFAADDQRVADLVQVVGRQTTRMQHMVEDFLNVSRIEADRALPMNLQRLDDLQKLVDEIVAVEGHGRSNHIFEVNLPDPTPLLWADRTKVEEIFANLIGNAIKFSPSGGRVTVSGQVQGDMVRFSVSDDGVGISEDDRQHLFQRFQRVGSSVKRIPGTGLGLFVCKHLIEAHGGEISVESIEGEGSTFHFTLPLYTDQDRDGPRDQDTQD